MSDIATTVTIDWLTITRPYQIPGNPVDVADNWLRSIASDLDITDGRPYPRNYTNARTCVLGTVSWHNEHPRMRVCLNMTGDNLREARRRGVDIGALVASEWTNDHKITRLDAAVDWYGAASIGDVVEHIEANPTCTLAQTLTPYGHSELSAGTQRGTVITGVYIGSRSSDRYICVYNKARERGYNDMLWHRIELRTRHEKADVLASAIANVGVVDAARAAIRIYASPDIDWWQQATQGPAVNMDAVGRPETDTQRWLLDIVADVLDRELYRVHSLRSPLIRTFRVIVERHVTRIVGEKALWGE